jgi:hypothetical protein
MRISGKRSDGIVAVHIGSGEYVLLDERRQRASGPIDERAMLAYGPWDDAPNDLSARRSVQRVLDRSSLTSLSDFDEAQHPRDGHGRFAASGVMENPSTAESIARSLTQAQKADDAHKNARGAMLDALPHGATATVGRRVYTKQHVAGDTFWVSAKDGLTSRQLAVELGTKLETVVAKQASMDRHSSDLVKRLDENSAAHKGGQIDKATWDQRQRALWDDATRLGVDRTVSAVFQKRMGGSTPNVGAALRGEHLTSVRTTDGKATLKTFPTRDSAHMYLGNMKALGNVKSVGYAKVPVASTYGDIMARSEQQYGAGNVIWHPDETRGH